MASHSVPKTLRTVAFHGFGLIAGALFVAPFFWSSLASFKNPTEATRPPMPPWPTDGISFDNYAKLATVGVGVVPPLLNSALVTGLTVLFTVIIATLAGYGFSRFRFPLRNALFVMLLATLMIPFQSILTPLFVLLTQLGLNNSLMGLVVVYVTLQMPFAVFMMRNAFDAVPQELEEAARIDGAGDLALLLRVLGPLVAPGIVTVAIFAALSAWNEFLAALIFLTDQSKYTLPLMITSIRSGRMGQIDWGVVQSSVTIMTVPCLLLFLLLQRYYMRGLMSGSVK